MFGAIVGDVIGSRFEFDNYRAMDFELFADDCYATDDSMMTVAVMAAIIDSYNVSAKSYDNLPEKTAKWMRLVGRRYPNRGYGGRFAEWIWSNSGSYNSFGNGAAMRISPVAYAARNEGELISMVEQVTSVTHSHPEGIKGALVTATCVWMALRGMPKAEIAEYAKSKYNLGFSLPELRKSYQFNETCQGTVPQAIFAFLQSKDFEDAIRIAVSIGGDTDTLAAITGSIADAYYGTPKEIEDKALSYLPNTLRNLALDFKSVY